MALLDEASCWSDDDGRYERLQRLRLLCEWNLESERIVPGGPFDGMYSTMQRDMVSSSLIMVAAGLSYDGRNRGSNLVLSFLPWAAKS
jgi:hypothetical protein